LDLVLEVISDLTFENLDQSKGKEMAAALGPLPWVKRGLGGYIRRKVQLWVIWA